MGIKTLTPHEVRRVAVKAFVDPRTVRCFLAGSVGKPSVKARIQAAMEKLGLSQSGPASGAAPDAS